MTESIDIMIRNAKQGDTEAFRVLVEMHQNYAFQLAYRFLRCEADARDAVQDAFIRVWKHLPRFNQRRKFTTWLYRIVVNIALDHIRKKKRRSEVLSNQVAEIQGDNDPEAACIQQETIECIQKAVEKLPKKQRQVFILRDLQELSIQETAQVLHCTEQAVKSHLYYARKKIRETLETDEDQ